jgi:hypothetical protein
VDAAFVEGPVPVGIAIAVLQVNVLQALYDGHLCRGITLMSPRSDRTCVRTVLAAQPGEGHTWSI